MPELVVVTRMVLSTTHALGRSRPPREVRVPGTWHLVEIVSGKPLKLGFCLCVP